MADGNKTYAYSHCSWSASVEVSPDFGTEAVSFPAQWLMMLMQSLTLDVSLFLLPINCRPRMRRRHWPAETASCLSYVCLSVPVTLLISRISQFSARRLSALLSHLSIRLLQIYNWSANMAFQALNIPACFQNFVLSFHDLRVPVIKKLVSF